MGQLIVHITEVSVGAKPPPAAIQVYEVNREELESERCKDIYLKILQLNLADSALYPAPRCYKCF